MPEDSGEPHRDWRRGGPEAGLVGGIGRFNTSPAITLRVRLENKGQTDLTVTIRDVDSVLGNFVPQPEKVSLKPGQSAELDPMTSRLGVVAATIPLTLSFRIGEKTETQKLVLREPAGAATPAAP